MTATRLHANNFATTLSVAISSTGATSATVVSTTGLPSLTGGNSFNLTLVNGSTIEIIKVTAFSGTSLSTIVRAQEGTSAATFPIGTIVSLRTTANSHDRKPDAPASSTAGGFALFSDTTGKVLSDASCLPASGILSFLSTPSSANLATAVTDESGSGLLVFNNTPTFITPILGTPTSGNLSNCTALPTGSITGWSTGINTFLVTPSSANLSSAITDETGSGLLVFNNTPTFISPLLGTPTSGILTNCTGLTVPGGGTGVATMTTAYAPVCAGTTATGALQVASSGIGNSGYILTSTGASSLPTWQAAAGGGNVTGPGSSTNLAIATFSGTGGTTLLNNSGVTISSGVVTTTSDASLNTLTVGLGGGSTSTNTVIGFQALSGNASGAGTAVVVGYQAGKAINGNTGGYTLVGYQAGIVMTTGTTGTTLIGSSSGATLVAGVGNTAIGASAMANAGTGSGVSNNTVMGRNVAQYMGSSDNVVIGYTAGTNASNVSYGQCVIVGSQAYTAANAGLGTSAAHVIIGYVAGAGLTSATQNTLVGWSSGTTATTMPQLTAVGYNSFSAATVTGAYNTGLGAGVGVSGATNVVSHTSGAGNTYIGGRAGGNSATCANAIAIGRDACTVIATGATSGTFGPGLAIGSAAFPVGFRGDGTIIPSTAGGAGFMKQIINGTAYYVPLFADASATIIGSGSVGIAGTTSPTFVTPVLGAASATSLSFSSTSGIIGTITNNNAAVGSVGEWVTSNVPNSAPVSLTSGANTNLTSITLTAGDWIVFGNTTFSAGLILSYTVASVSSTSATPAADRSNQNFQQLVGATFSLTGMDIPVTRFSLSGTTTIYLVVQVGDTGTATVSGNLSALRTR